MSFIQQRIQLAWVKSFVLIALIAIGCAPAWAATPPIVYVDWDGGGDYNTDGVNDEVQINQALTFVGANLGSGYTTVYLRGAHDYIIDNSVKIPSGVTLTGDSTACIKLVNSAGWASNVPMITATGTSGMHDITVHGFEIDGNDANQPGINRGQSYYKALVFIGTTRLYVYDMYIHHNTDDGLKVSSSSYVYYHDNQILNHGHDGLQTYNSSYIYFYNNVVTNRTNAGVRFADSNHCEAYGNDISTASGGNAAIQIQRSNSGTVMDDIKIHDNRLHTSAGPGVWLFCNQSTTYTQDKARNVHIYNNVFYSCNGGIQTTGWYDTYVDNNVFDACGNAIYIYANPSFPPPSGGTGYDTHLNNNILCYNTYGIRQTYTNGSHTVDSDYDDFYSNTTNNSGSGVTITHQLTSDPKFVDRANRNYYLKSTGGHWNGSGWSVDAEDSPLIDAGDPSFSYTNEPTPNGSRINVDAYGNTAYASKSSGGGALPTSMDNRLKDTAPTTVYSSNTFLDIGYNGTAKYRGIIWFDLDPYMDDAASSIVDSKLSMYWYYPSTTRAADTVVQVMKPESGWDHGYVCWNNKANGTAWSYAGGDWTDSTGASQGTSPFASVTFPAGTVATNQYYDWNVTSLVQGIITAGVNPGMFIKASSEASSNYIAFYATDNASYKPKLSITRLASQTEGTTAYDNRIKSLNPTTVYATSTYNDVGYLVSGTSSFRDLIWFDLSAFDETTQVTKATLKLYWYYPATARTNDTIVDIYRPASGWNKDYVCWTNKASGVAWTNAGGDWYDANGTAQGTTPFASITFDNAQAATNQYYEFDVTALVNYYKAGHTNAGFFIKARTESDNYISFYSLNNADYKPRLEITTTVQQQ